MEKFSRAFVSSTACLISRVSSLLIGAASVRPGCPFRDRDLERFVAGRFQAAVLAVHQVLEEVRGQQGRVELFGEQGVGFAVDTGSSRQLAGVHRFQYVQRHAAETVARDRFVTIPQRTRYLIPIH
ncbi:hypothetical protein [Burkholderia gladioli]|uniref:hypothetical protein n=1 Tax=Burkholderia gladioli TaxID=28095 RepID=UPI002364744E|nr:hypothetical protein [Burkholderia gladioli]MDD1787801.1 hypothetical protein [Burkholderia gladioli]